MMTIFRNLIDAGEFAARAHGQQTRKLTDTPVIAHPLGVALYLGTLGFDLETIMIGALHDTIEDCGVEGKDICQRYGDRVGQGVVAVTYDLGEPTLALQRQKYYTQLTTLELQAIALVDNLYNMISTLIALEEDRDAFQKLGTSPRAEIDHWRAVIEIVRSQNGNDTRIQRLITESEEVIRAIVDIIGVAHTGL